MGKSTLRIAGDELAINQACDVLDIDKRIRVALRVRRPAAQIHPNTLRQISKAHHVPTSAAIHAIAARPCVIQSDPPPPYILSLPAPDARLSDPSLPVRTSAQSVPITPLILHRTYPLAARLLALAPGRLTRTAVGRLANYMM